MVSGTWNDPGVAMVDKKNSPSSRRGFLSRIWSFLGIVALLQIAAGVVFFLNSDRKRAGKQKMKRLQAGAVSDFPPGSVTLISEGHLYLSRLDDGAFLAISRKCTHLGCAVPWVDERKQFECPCHASIFDRTGMVLKSPAPRALDLFSISFEDDLVVIDVSAPVRRSIFKAAQLAYPGKNG